MILGIDPWIRKLGYAIITPWLEIVEAGILKLALEATTKNTKRLEQYQRMLDIQAYFAELLKKHPDIKTISMEKYFFTNFNKSNAEFVYGVRGILLSMALQQGKTILEYTPIELKKNITGNSKANKLTIQKTIKKIFQLQEIPEYDDAADALWLALLGINK